MLVVYVNYGKWRYFLCPAFLTGQIFSMQYATMPHNLIFVGINLLLPNCACIKSGCTEKMLMFFLCKLEYTSTAIFPCSSFPFLSTPSTVLLIRLNS